MEDPAQESRIEKAMDGSALYLTAFVRDGQVHFRNDPYGKDRRAMGRVGAPAMEPPAPCEEVERLL